MKKRIKSALKKIIRHLIQKFLKQRVDISLDTWRLEKNSHNFLSLSGVELQPLLKKYGSPLFVADEQKLQENVLAVQSSGIELFYSYKTNPVPALLQQMHKIGVGAELISEQELWLALHLKVPGNKIIYNGPVKSDRSLPIAIEANLLSINVNHIEEIERIELAAKSVGKRARVSVRVNSPSGWLGQLGLPTQNGEALSAVEKILKSEFLEFVGVHCHRGVLLKSVAEIENHVDFLLSVVSEIKSQFGKDIQLLNLGGSLGIPTVRYLTETEKKLGNSSLLEPASPSAENFVPLQEYSRICMQRILDYFERVKLPMPRIVCEHGRAITGNAMHLLFTAVDVRKTADFDYILADAGIGFCSPLPSEFHQLFPLKIENTPKTKYRVAGPLCHLGDTLYRAWSLPLVKKQDGFIVMDSGAYFVPEGNSFSFPQPGIVSIASDGKVTEIRVKQSFEHVISRDVYTL